MRFWSSLPTMLKFWMVISWPVMLWWSYIGEGPSDVPSTSHQMFWMTPLSIHHHSPPFGIWICKWCHFSLWCDLCLWGSSGILWWYCLLCNAPVPHVYCICSLYSHSGLSHKVGPCRFALAYAVIGVFFSFWFLFSGCLDLVFHPVEGPVGVLIFFQDLFQMMFFLFQQLLCWTYCFCPVVSGTHHTVLCCNGMMAIPLQI